VKLLRRFWIGFRIVIGAPCCPESFRRLAQRAVPAHRLNCWTQASQVLRIKRVQGCCDSRSDPNDSFFHAWAKQRDPKLTADKQCWTPHGRRTAWMSHAIKVHLFHRCRCIIHGATDRRNLTVIFLHLCIERMAVRDWMWSISYSRDRGRGTPPEGVRVGVRRRPCPLRFSPIGQSAARPIVRSLARDIYV
jgi:hypothetical protein